MIASYLTGKLDVIVREDNERGVIAKKAFKAGEFVCEFEANLLTEEEMKLAEEYERDGIPVYSLEVRQTYRDSKWQAINTVQFSLRHMVIFLTQQRDRKYINHAASGANIKLFPPILARGKMRIGFVSLMDYSIYGSTSTPAGRACSRARISTVEPGPHPPKWCAQIGNVILNGKSSMFLLPHSPVYCLSTPISSLCL